MHLGLVLGEAGFSRVVAVKRLLPELARDPELVTAFLDEARLASRIRHPNVVPTLDVLAEDGEIFVVMEYVHGESLAGLVRAAAGRGQRIPVAVVSAVVANALHGLHAAHEARDERGEPLALVHRDVSPQNLLVGADGIARVVDFGIAKAAGRAQMTREGQVKGKLGYMAPEQLRQSAERASDVYAAGVCLWEALTLERLFAGDNESVVLAKIMAGVAPPPSSRTVDVPPALDALTLRALHRDPEQRFASAREMARALEAAIAPAPPSAVSEWVSELVASRLAHREEQMAALEASRPLGAATEPLAAPAPPARGTEVETRRSAVPAALPVVEAAPGAAPASTEAFTASPRAAPRRWAWLAGGGLSMLLATGALFASVPRAAPPTLEGTAAPAPAPSAAMETAADTAALPATNPGSAATDATSAPSSPVAAAAARRRHQAAPAASKIDCDPPYSVGADQVRHYKKQCLR